MITFVNMTSEAHCHCNKDYRCSMKSGLSCFDEDTGAMLGPCFGDFCPDDEEGT
jgi:hypothetical protein